jgi:hypothetical protein
MDFEIEKMLKPYVEGGTESSPVKRSLKTIASILIYKNGFSPDIVGAAIFKVFDRMINKGLAFQGDGSYGSKGRELFSCIKAQCVDIAEKQSADAVRASISEIAACTRTNCPQRTKEMKIVTRWDRIVLFLNRPRGFWRL